MPSTTFKPSTSDIHSVSKSSGPAGWTEDGRMPSRAGSQSFQRSRISPEGDAILAQGFHHARQKVRRNRPVDEQRVQRIAHGRALGLGVVDDRQGGLQVGALVHENVTDARPAGDDRDAAVLTAEAVQACAAARDDDIHILVQLQEFQHQGTVGLSMNCTASGGRPCSSSAEWMTVTRPGWCAGFHSRRAG